MASSHPAQARDGRQVLEIPGERRGAPPPDDLPPDGIGVVREAIDTVTAERDPRLGPEEGGPGQCHRLSLGHGPWNPPFCDDGVAARARNR